MRFHKVSNRSQPNAEQCDAMRCRPVCAVAVRRRTADVKRVAARAAAEYFSVDVERRDE